MIKWKEQQSEIIIQDITDLFALHTYDFAINAILESFDHPQIFITSSCLEDIKNHLNESNEELGGLLIGKTFKLSYDTEHGYNYFSQILKNVRSTDFNNSSVSLRMTPDVWSAASKLIDNDELIIGWYHSHPNLGVFFSSTDRFTQKNFFNNPYSLGIVFDPIRNERATFFGKDSKQIPSNFIILENDNTLFNFYSTK